MSVITKDLGAATAYAYAVEKGYTGTEAEFAELMADYAEVGQRAEDAADSALESKTAAQTAATTATNKATEATTAATTATTKAGEASTSASTATSAKDTAVSASQTATTKATEATTAAATATSAATTATTAKDDAVSAKTAAQTAQTGAETAAASVEASAEQIATNAEDISQLKSDLNNSIQYDPRLGITPEITSGYYNLYTGAFTENDSYSNFKIWYSKLPNVTNDFHSIALWKNGKFVGGYARANIPETLPDFDEVAIIWYKKTYQTGDVVILDNSVLLDRLETSETDISNLDKLLYVQKTNQIVYLDMMEFDLGYINQQGNVVSYANAYVSDFIEIVPSTNIEYNLYVIVRSMYGITWYDSNKNRLGGVNQPDGSGGSWSNINGTVTLPETAKYIRINARKMDSDSDARRQNVTYTGTDSMKNVVTQLAEDTNHWSGKNWYAFGTSITDTNNTLGVDGTPTGKYVPYLAELSGMVVTNYGIAGGTIGNTSTGNILTRIKNTDLSGADLITLEGFVNDFVGNLPLGAIGDTDNSTFAGALYDAITYIQSNSDATLVLITETTGRTYDIGDFVVTRANANGVYQYQFNDMIKTMSAYLGVHCIDAGQKSQINQWNVQYLADWIHHTELGGKQYANTIWDELKNIHCNSDVSVS